MEAHGVNRIIESLQRGTDVATLKIVGRKNSAPRDIGSWCVVDGDGALTGSVGGGFLEFRALEEAKRLLKKRKAVAATFSLSKKDIIDQVMICGSDVEILIEVFLHDRVEDLALYQYICEYAFTEGKRVSLVTEIPKAQKEAVGRRLFVDGQAVWGDLTLETVPSDTDFARVQQESSDFLVESFAAQPALIVFGAGHVGAATVKLGKDLGFHTVLVDDREEFIKTETLSGVDERILSSFSDAIVADIFSAKQLASRAYVVIATRSHLHDYELLLSLVQRACDVEYIGMVGSRGKRAMIEEKLVHAGISMDKLPLFLPVGLDIEAQTPMEIAVSVMAEIIAQRNQKPVFSGPNSKKTGQKEERQSNRGHDGVERFPVPSIS